MSDERSRFLHGDPESVERVIAYLKRRAAQAALAARLGTRAYGHDPRHRDN